MSITFVVSGNPHPREKLIGLLQDEGFEDIGGGSNAVLRKDDRVVLFSRDKVGVSLAAADDYLIQIVNTLQPLGFYSYIGDIVDGSPMSPEHSIRERYGAILENVPWYVPNKI